MSSVNRTPHGAQDPPARRLVILDEEEPRHRTVPIASQWPRVIRCRACEADLGGHSHVYAYKGHLPLCIDCAIRRTGLVERR